MIEVPRERFEELVADALDSIPTQLGRYMDNVAVFVEDDPPHPDLLGLYQGVPLTKRSAGYAGAMPDRITIYRLAICEVCETEDDVLDEVQAELDLAA